MISVFSCKTVSRPVVSPVESKEVLTDKKEILKAPDDEQKNIPPLEEKNEAVKSITQGWGKEPESVKASGNISPGSGKIWYYKTVKSEPSKRAIELKSPSYQEYTCGLHAMKENREKFFMEMHSSLEGKIITKEELPSKKEQLDKLQVLSCKPLGENSVFTSCECILVAKHSNQ